MTASTMRLPGKSSRTRTHAISVPSTALIAATISALATVNRMAAAASGAVAASQNEAAPSFRARHTTAPSGMNTSRLIHSVAKPTPNAVPELSRRSPERRPNSGGCSVAVASANGHADSGFDVGHDAALRIEELRCHVRPPTEVGDGEQAWRGREVVLTLHSVDHGSVAVVGEDLLRFRRADEVEECLRLLRMLGRARDGSRILDEDGRIRNDVVDVLALLLGEDRLVLVRQQHIALARGERLQRLAGAVVLHRDVVEQRVQVG